MHLDLLLAEDCDLADRLSLNTLIGAFPPQECAALIMVTLICGRAVPQYLLVSVLMGFEVPAVKDVFFVVQLQNDTNLWHLLSCEAHCCDCSTVYHSGVLHTIVVFC